MTIFVTLSHRAQLLDVVLSRGFVVTGMIIAFVLTTLIHMECGLDHMDADSEIIALLLPERTPRRGAVSLRDRAQGAQRLIRDSNGRIVLEDVESEEDFDRTARITGCFRRGKPIRDPGTREVIGYEMEEVAAAGAAAG